ncbi:MAG: metallopeptidase family protein [Verrucomicrobia bacterium]|nr:metallopeptidase family protein [Verrucomicrobiota bacterium]
MSDWAVLQSIAEEVVAAAIASLPAEFKREAEGLPVTYDPRPDEALRHLDLDGTLGLFVGPSRLDPDGEAEVVPPQIILFLVNIWQFAEGKERIYRHEVRTTYLHELGHYFGLEEIDLEKNGL